jgi:protein-S-isoprenylcysteine O-methyltransferase Ste14
MIKESKTPSPLKIILFLVLIVVVPMLPLLISWQWDWWQAWAYAAISILGFAISRYLAGRSNPGLLAEREQSFQHQNSEKWDQVLSPALMLMGMVMPLLAGLERRFSPSGQFGLTITILAMLFMVLGYALGAYALIANRFFSGVVRIQTERGHHVVDRGPYRWMRHPGYSGSLISHPAIPLLLGSWWAFIPAVIAIVIIFIRTSLEDRTLHEKLDGYSEYARRVRYRLIPSIW